MPNGQLTGSHTSATQGALLVPAPEQFGRYYLFTVDALENGFAGGLRYSTISMALRGGLGDVELPKSVPVPIPGGGLVTEKLTAVLHANGHDYWILVHSLNSEQFYSYLLTAAGLSLTPVVSSVGASNAPYTGNYGWLRASPDGQLLASVHGAGVELFDFNKATGLLTLRRGVYSQAGFYGAEFSADNTKLYISLFNALLQLDLTINNAPLLNVNGVGAVPYFGGILRGPDGRIYCARRQRQALAIIESPNLAGTACNLRLNAFSLAPTTNGESLPNFPNAFAPAPLMLAPRVACVNTSIQVAVGPVWSTYSYTWSFGDSSAPVTGPTATHAYAQVGTYTITLTMTPLAGGPVLVQQQLILVSAPPTLRLGPPQQLACAGAGLTLGPVGGPLPGLTYQWRDGVAGPVRQVQQPGRYVLTATSAAGCSVRDSVEVTVLLAPPLHLQAPSVLCPDIAFVTLQANPQPPGTTYRWQDGTTSATYLARHPGRYRLEVHAPNGCLAADSVEVRGQAADGACEPFAIPNVITPNGDGANDYFVVRGLYLPDWKLELYNRWGRRVWQQAGYDNRWAAEDQPAGVYYYLLTNEQTNKRLRGWVEVVK
jgi:gliding motility-associated-like protein